MKGTQAKLEQRPGVLSADRGTRFLWGPFLGPQIGRWLGTHSTPGTIVRQRPKRRLEYHMNDQYPRSFRIYVDLFSSEGGSVLPERDVTGSNLPKIFPNSLTFSFPLFPVL
jgi:hypothetical protein